MKFYITGNRRGLGKYLSDRLNVVKTLEECDVFINCKHEDQVDKLYEVYELNKEEGYDIRVINISSNSGDGIKRFPHKYAVEKMALDAANEQLFYLGMNTTCLRFGWLDTERVSEVEAHKMSLKSALDTLEFVLLHPHRVKELTVVPEDEFYHEQLKISEKLYDSIDMYAGNFKKLNRKYNITKIKEEIKNLPALHDNQIMLQSLDGEDFYTGLLQIDKLPAGKSEDDFNKLNVPEDSEIGRFITNEKLTRTRLLILPEKSCYTFHFDPTPRIHLAVVTNEWSFMTDSKWKLRHVPADGYPYYFDTTKAHTAINSALEDRIHIVGIAPAKWTALRD